jgi:hypothetical protein
MQDKIIELWKELKITEVIFTFDCGGDSMGNTAISIETENGEIENKEIESYFDNQVYNNVTFYEVSDGHYLGESGTVSITLNEDIHDDLNFEYAKTAKAEFSETVDKQVELELTPDQLDFINKYVDSFGRSRWADEQIIWNYTKDFVLTDELIATRESIAELAYDAADNCEFDTSLEINEDDYVAIHYELSTSKSESNKITIDLTTEAYRYEDSY